MTTSGTTSVGGVPRWLLDRLPARFAEHLRQPLYRNGYALVVATGATSLLGALYWLIAARRYSPADVGRNSALIASMTFLANLAHLNLTNGLNRFVPTAGTRTGRLIGLSYVVTAALAVVAGLVYIGGIDLWSPELTDLVRQNPWAVLAFVTATALWVVFQLEDSVLIGLGRADWVLVENSAFGVAKIVALVALATALPKEGIFASWTLPLVFVVVPVNVLVFRRLVPRHHAAADDTTVEPVRLRELGHYLTADYFSSLLWVATTSLLPVVVLAIVGPTQSAFFYLSWTIAYTLYLLSRVLGMSLVTEGARAPQRLYEFALRTLAQCGKIVVPLAILVALASPLILRVLGSEYQSGAAWLLPLLVLSAIPNVVITTFLSAARVQRRMRAVVVVTAAMSVSVMALSVLFLDWYGLTGVGVAWLVAQSGVALVLLATELRALWLPRVPFHRLPHRARAHPHPAATSSVLDTLPEWERLTGARVDHDVGSVVVRPRRGGDPAVLRFARTELGARSLQRHVAALGVLDGDHPADGGLLTPAPIACGTVDGLPWVIETRLPGADARIAARRVGADLVVARAADAIRVLHEASAAETTVDDDTLVAWVDEPIAELRATAATPLRVGADRAALDRMQAHLRDELAGRVLTTCFVHGDYWLGNVLASDDGTITGIVDWERAGVPGLAAVDLMTLVLTSRVEARRRELGPVVRDLLLGEPFAGPEHAVLAAGPGAGELGERTVLLLAWLHHAASNLQKRNYYRASTIWVTTNVGHVLEKV